MVCGSQRVALVLALLATGVSALQLAPGQAPEEEDPAAAFPAEDALPSEDPAAFPANEDPAAAFPAEDALPNEDPAALPASEDPEAFPEEGALANEAPAALPEEGAAEDPEALPEEAALANEAPAAFPEEGVTDFTAASPEEDVMEEPMPPASWAAGPDVEAPSALEPPVLAAPAPEGAGADAEAPEKKSVPAAPAPPGRLCAAGTLPYQAIGNQRGTTVCSVFCLAEGRCQGLAQTGKLGYIGIQSEGNCRKAGYTESYRVRNETLQWARTLSGPCRGMTVANFVKPGVPTKQQALPSFRKGDQICPGKTTAYEAHHPQHPNTCAVYCVPEGRCEGLVQSGKLMLGISSQGNCRGRGFTKSSTNYGVMGENVIDMLKGFHGACKGMRYAKFEKPEV